MLSSGSVSSSREPFTQGLVEIFTGEGKGKTSAALGMVLRALGYSLRVFVTYFMKGDSPYGEQKILSQLPNVAVAKFGHRGFVARDNVTEADKEEAKKGLEMSRKAMLSHDYDVIILDEINVAIAWKLVDLNEVVELIQEKPENVELILTGRYADDRLIEMADLVTDMTKVKHPYDKGILARKGIDY